MSQQYLELEEKKAQKRTDTSSEAIIDRGARIFFVNLCEFNSDCFMESDELRAEQTNE